VVTLALALAANRPATSHVDGRYFEAWQQVYSKLPDGTLDCMIACREEKSGKGFVAHGATLELAILKAMESCAKDDTFRVDDRLFNESLNSMYQKGSVSLDWVYKLFNIGD
jgi:hypothetical protein